MTNRQVTGLLIIVSTLVISGLLFFNERRSQTCNTMVSLAPGKTLTDVCTWWEGQTTSYRQANRYCGCGPYK